MLDLMVAALLVIALLPVAHATVMRRATALVTAVLTLTIFAH